MRNLASRSLRSGTAFAALSFLLSAAPASAQNAQTIDTLHQKIELQSRQIESLTREVVRLSQLLEGESTTPAPTSAPTVRTSDTAPQTPATPAPATMDPNDGASAVHVVAKGETLTAIARKYGVSVDELQTFNGIKDARLIQIGQNVRIPAANEASTDSASGGSESETLTPPSDPGVTPP